ncbi:MAG: hypothetical protein [Bacteriophage sp.]|nr:MAG: hypothetical protein [Bacteriophage sp.]
MQQLYVEVKNKSGYGSTCRPATDEEAEKALEYQSRSKSIRKKIRKLENELEAHLKEAEENDFVNAVFYDSPGMPYDVRHFVATDNSSLI